MMAVAWSESAGAMLSILTPLVAVPLTVITFYLRSLREHQISRHADLLRRMDSLEASSVELRKTLAEFERDFATKEEWLRECMLARQTLNHLGETTVRIETQLQAMDSTFGLRNQPTRSVETRAAVDPTDRLAVGRDDEGIG